jgi:hypothetical protein
MAAPPFGVLSLEKQDKDGKEQITFDYVKADYYSTMGLKKAILLFSLHSQKPEDGFFFVASISSGINTNGWEFPSFPPSFNG